MKETDRNSRVQDAVPNVDLVVDGSKCPISSSSKRLQLFDPPHALTFKEGA